MLALIALPCAALLSGCGFKLIPAVPSAPAGPYQFLTGNWVLEGKRTSGVDVFTSMGGFINEGHENPGVDDVVTGAFQAQGSACFQGDLVIPLHGDVNGNTLSLYSFDIYGQYLAIDATRDATATHLTGTYHVGGGCANEAKGTISGTRYAALTGSYAGTLSGSPAETLLLTLTQNSLGTGSGAFFISGSAAFGGFSCFTSGTTSNAFVVGKTVQLQFQTNEATGSQITLTGTMDSAARQISLSDVAVHGGACAGSFGGTTLTQQ